MKKYLVTGGAGFIGSNIVRAILEKGDFVRIIDNFSTGRKENIEEFKGNSNFELLEGDITNLDFAKQSVDGIDFVLHQAAIPSVQRSVGDPLKSNNANINGTLNMLLASKDAKVKRFVYAASSSVYGENLQLPKIENMAVMPISPYALQKYTGERYCQIFWKLYGLPTICLRYFNVFGPNQDPNSQYSAVIPKFIKSLLKGEKPVIYGAGEQSRDFTFIDNVVNINLLSANSEKGFGEVFNVACNEETSLNQLLKMLNDILKINIDAEYKDVRVGDVLHSKADISKATEILGYMPKVKIKEGLEKTVDWYKNNGK